MNNFNQYQNNSLYKMAITTLYEPNINRKIDHFLYKNGKKINNSGEYISHKHDNDDIYYPSRVPTNVAILEAAEVEGAWTLRFGKFGWPERDMRGGVIKIDISGAMFGGDSNFVYRGNLILNGSGLSGMLTMDRHGADPEYKNTFGTDDNHYDLMFSVEPISSDHMVGYFQRSGFADVHLSMMRL